MRKLEYFTLEYEFTASILCISEGLRNATARCLKKHFTFQQLFLASNFININKKQRREQLFFFAFFPFAVSVLLLCRFLLTCNANYFKNCFHTVSQRFFLALEFCLVALLEIRQVPIHSPQWFVQTVSQVSQLVKSIRLLFFLFFLFFFSILKSSPCQRFASNHSLSSFIFLFT